MRKLYIFSEMFGSYSYTVIFVVAESIEEARKKNEDLAAVLIRDYNYFPEEDIDVFDYTNNPAGWEDIKNAGIDRWSNEEISKLPLFQRSYKDLLQREDVYKRIGISKREFLKTNKEGWFDWILVYTNLPEDYSYMDGHDG